MSESSATSSDRFVDDTSTHDEDAVDLRGIIITLRKYRWPIILTTAAVTALTALIVSTITPQFRATATLLFENNRSQTGFETPWADLENNSLSIQTQVEVLKSRTLAERLVQELKLAEHWEYNSSLPIPERYKSSGPLAQIGKFVEKIAPTRQPPAVAVDGATPIVNSEAMVRKLMSRTRVTPLKQTNLVKVSVDGIDRELASRIANGTQNIRIPP